MSGRACHREPLSISFTVSTSFSTGVHLWIGSMSRKKTGKSDKAATSASFLSLPQLLTHSHILHQAWKPLGLRQWQDKRCKYEKAQLQLPEPDTSKASQHGRCRLVSDTSAGVVPFCTLAGTVWQHLSVGYVLLAGSLVFVSCPERLKASQALAQLPQSDRKSSHQY